MNYLGLIEKIKAKKQALVVIILVVALVLTTTLISSAVTASEKTTDYYDVKLGNKTIATVSSKAEADKVVDGVKSYYVKEGAEVLSVKCNPAITVESRQTKQSEKAPKVTKNTDKIVKRLVTGDVEEKYYEVKEGDAMFEVAGDLGLTYEELENVNKDKDLNNLLPGDKVKYQKSEPMVDVVVEQKAKAEEEIPFDTKTETSADMYEDQSSVKEYGESGRAEVTKKLVVKNGEVVSSKILKKNVIKEPKAQVEVKGTKKKVTASANGGGILGRAASYYGTSYSAMDCYAFVAAVYSSLGYNMSNFVSVPISEMQPGDLLVHQYHHYAIYAGGGMETHSIMGRGVCTTPFSYVAGYNGGIAQVLRPR